MSFQKESSSSALRIRLLRGFIVYIKGEAIPETAIKGRKARTLLKLIAHQHQYRVVREHIIEILWPDLEMAAANSQLYKAVHHIRKAFGRYHKGGEEWIEITENLIRLTPSAGIITDVELFEKSARSGLKDREPYKLESALSMYGGDFLPTDRYAKWASFPREHYRQLYLDVLTMLAVVYEEQEELSEASEMLRLALDKEPTLEVAHRGLMRVFAKKGQATRAYHQYDACREILREELGLTPSSDTMKTLDDIGEGKFRNKPQACAHQASVSGFETPLIGRTEECNSIDQHLENLSAENGGCIGIIGEIGIGKTRVVQELIRSTRQKELSFFIGSAIKNVAYGPFIEVFIDILNNHPGMENMLPGEIGYLIPGFSGKEHPVPQKDKLLAKAYLFAQIHRFLSKLTTERPAVIILEDLHAADQGSLSLLTYLIRHRGQLPILFVATMRKQKSHIFQNFILDRQGDLVEVLELSPLTYEEHERLIHQHAGNAIIGADTVSHIFQLSEGNPLYALELLHHFTENSDVVNSKQHLDGSTKPSSSASGHIPVAVLQVVEEKLQKLSPQARHLLYIAAVIGRKVSYGLLESIWIGGSRHAENGLFQALEEVIHDRLLEEHGLDYSFHHAMVHETIYSFISNARRQILHRQIANQLLELSENRNKVPVELIAWHYLGARDMMEAAKFLKRAGERAESVYAYENAHQCYREAMKVLDRMESYHAKNLKCGILERIGDVYRISGRFDKCYDAYEEAMSHTEGISFNDIVQLELNRKMAVASVFRSEIDRSDRHLEEAFELVGDNPCYQARLFISKSHYLWHLDRLEEAYEEAKKALGKAQKADATSEGSQACEMLAMICLSLGRWEESLQYENERQALGGSPEVMVATDLHQCMGVYHISEDEALQKARSFIGQTNLQDSQVENLQFMAEHQKALNKIHFRTDQNSNSGFGENTKDPIGMAYSLARKSVLYTLLGMKDQGWQHVQEGFVHCRQASQGVHCLQRLYGVGIWNRLEADEPEEAGKLIMKSEDLIARSKPCSACTLELYPWFSYYFLQTEQFEKVRACFKAVSEFFERTGNLTFKVILTMIKSSLLIVGLDRKQADEYSRSSYQLLKEAVPRIAHSGIKHFLDRMLEQQSELKPQ